MAASDRDLLASDAERDHVVEQLRRHAADGRLTMDEFEQRVTEALAARTRGDLDPVLRELPPLAPAKPEAPASRRLRPPGLPSSRMVLTAAVIVVAAVMVLQGAWWIIFPLMGLFGGCGRGRRGWGTCSTGRSDHRGRHVRDHRAGTDTDDGELIRV